MGGKPCYPRACSYYVPVSDENYERALFWNKGLSEPVWSPQRQVAIHTIKIDKLRMAYANAVDYEQVEVILAHFDRFQWMPISLDHEGYLLDGQHRLEVCRRKELLFVDAVMLCADHARIEHEAQERGAEEERRRKHKQEDLCGNWLTRAEWKELYGTTRGFAENQ